MNPSIRETLFALVYALLGAVAVWGVFYSPHWRAVLAVYAAGVLIAGVWTFKTSTQSGAWKWFVSVALAWGSWWTIVLYAAGNQRQRTAIS
jgi:hypothetical protein